ncbi:hypothetical protein [Bacillus sp. FSL K6-6540]|uniref:hypothetical protein n=1 Tax=Bacillus sp. FSL K6-6540 TaxID=2921512 RepID=UPI0030F71FE0
MAMKRIPELDELTPEEWIEILRMYLMNSKQAAEELEVSVPRVFQYSSNGQLHSIVKGYFLRSEVENLGYQLKRRRRTVRRDKNILTNKKVHDLFVELYLAKRHPVTRREVMEAAAKIDGLGDRTIVEYRVTNAIQSLVHEKKIRRIKKGYYIPCEPINRS